MGGKFIDGLIKLTVLEKRPQNLMLLFSWLIVIVTEWDIQGHVQDLWDAVSRYFPIHFKLRPGDTSTLTVDDLRIRSRICMAATNEFAPLAFPMLIDKIDYQVTADVKVGSGTIVCAVVRQLTSCSWMSCGQ